MKDSVNQRLIEAGKIIVSSAMDILSILVSGDLKKAGKYVEALISQLGNLQTMLANATPPEQGEAH